MKIKYTEERIKSCYDAVIRDIKLGIPIIKTLCKLKISSDIFYNRINQQQKEEIKTTRLLCSKSCFDKRRNSLSYVHNIELSFETEE